MAAWLGAAACDGRSAAAAERRVPARGAPARAAPARGAAVPPCDAPWIASSARAVNAAGAVAGSVLGADTTEHPAVWTADGLRDLGLPPGASHAQAVAITAGGDVVVDAWRRVRGAPDPRADARAFVWHGGAWTPVDGLPRAAGVYATAANNRGLVVGFFTDSAGADHAFAWRGPGRPASVLSADAGGASANAVNDRGVIAGAAGRATAFVWRPGTADTLDYLFRDPPAVWSAAVGVSEGGVVVGGVRMEDGPGIQPFVFRPNRSPNRGGRGLGHVAVPAHGGEYTAVSPRGTLRVGHHDGRRAFVAGDAGTRTLPAVPGFDEARPAAVNDAGVVVGTASLPDPTRASYGPGPYGPGPGTRAVVWRSTGARSGVRTEAPRLLPLATVGCAPDPVGAPSPR